LIRSIKYNFFQVPRNKRERKREREGKTKGNEGQREKGNVHGVEPKREREREGERKEKGQRKQ
jgi:hypothetical protein